MEVALASFFVRAKFARGALASDEFAGVVGFLLRLHRGGLGDFEDDAAVYLAFLHALEDIVDRAEGKRFDGGFHFAFGGEGERFLEIEARADDGAADGEAVEDHVENGNGEIAGGQAVENAGAAATQHADRLLEGNGRDGGDENALSAANLALNFRRRILSFRVNGDFSAELASERHFFGAEINGGYVQAHGFGVLNGDVAESAGAGNDDPLAGLGAGELQTFVGGDAGAENRGGVGEGKIFRQAAEIIGLAEGVLREAAVHGIAGIFLFEAERFPPARQKAQWPQAL